MSRYQSRVAVVTGASSGIGAVLALRIAERGSSVALFARRAKVLDHLAHRITEAGGRALPVPVDVARPEDVKSGLEKVRADLGSPDLVIANAGIGWQDDDSEWTADRAIEIYRVNVLGALAVIHGCLPEMVASGRGRICGIASVAAFQGMPGNGAYCGSKAALRIELEALRVRLRPKGILVTTVCPGFIRTPMTDVHDFDMPFLMEVNDAVRIILAAIDRGRREVSFPWRMAVLTRTGRLLPRALLDRVLRYRPKGPRTQAKSGEAR